jgi:hypothetical protein
MGAPLTAQPVNANCHLCPHATAVSGTRTIEQELVFGAQRMTVRINKTNLACGMVALLGIAYFAWSLIKYLSAILRRHRR